MQPTMLPESPLPEVPVSRRQALQRVAGVSLAVAAAEPSGQGQTAKARSVTTAEFLQLMKQLSNWNRWGKDDQLGAVNLIAPAKRKQAVSLVKEGASFSMARNAEIEAAVDNRAPIVRKTTRAGAAASATGMDNTGDSFFISYHGCVHTHVDALCHFLYDGKMYNGHSKELLTENGAEKNSVFNFKHGFMTRGILMDMARHKGVEYLKPGDPIYPEDLDAWEKKTRVKVGSGDVVLVRTGRWARRDAKAPWPIADGMAGLHVSCAKWLHERDVAILGGDGAQDVLPSGVEGVGQPVHVLVLVAMGMPIFDNCDLEWISKEADRRRRWEFLVTASPAAVPGATGSVLNPIATF